MSPIQSRRIESTDAAILRDVRLRALQTDPLSFGSTYAREAARDEAAWRAWAAEHSSGDDKATFLALRGATAIGLSAAMRSTEDVHRFGLFSMWVAPEARRQSVGRQLVEMAVDWAMSMNGTEITLWVTRPSAVTFYERCGFMDDGRRERLVHSPDVVEIGMTRVLTQRT